MDERETVACRSDLLKALGWEWESTWLEVLPAEYVPHVESRYSMVETQRE
jgi:hypothetical protein